jgi:hypothetical protein
VNLTDFLTEAQIAKAHKLYDTYGQWDSVARIEAQVIAPNLATINEKLGQENNARYLAYACVYVFSQLRQERGN